MHQSAEYQNRKRLDKEVEEKRRRANLAKDPVDITPPNRGNFPWAGQDPDAFEKEWSMKPVTLRGKFDHNKEYKVKKMFNGEKGYEIVTPFYTHLNDKEEPCAILVSRGWLSGDLDRFRLHYFGDDSQVTGVLYRGDNQYKYAKPNNPQVMDFTSVKPEEMTLISQIPNKEEANQFMLKVYDTDEQHRQVYPHAQTAEEIASDWRINPQRHLAYESLWRLATYAGVLANTAAWLYL